VQDVGGDVVDIGSDNVGDNVGSFDHCKLLFIFFAIVINIIA